MDSSLSSLTVCRQNFVIKQLHWWSLQTGKILTVGDEESIASLGWLLKWLLWLRAATIFEHPALTKKSLRNLFWLYPLLAKPLYALLPSSAVPCAQQQGHLQGERWWPEGGRTGTFLWCSEPWRHEHYFSWWRNLKGMTLTWECDPFIFVPKCLVEYKLWGEMTNVHLTSGFQETFIDECDDFITDICLKFEAWFLKPIEFFGHPICCSHKAHSCDWKVISVTHVLFCLSKESPVLTRRETCESQA